MSYYPPPGSHYSHSQPVVYSGSHQSGYNGYQEAYPGGYAPQYATTNGYLAPGYNGAGGGVVYVPSSSGRSSHRSRSRSRHGHHHHHSSSQPVVIAPSSYGHHHSSSHSRYSRHHSGLSFGERLRRFFGFAPRQEGVEYKRQGSHSSWGFFGRSRRRRYIDARTGVEVDKRGRPVYRV